MGTCERQLWVECLAVFGVCALLFGMVVYTIGEVYRSKWRNR